jgi:ABC-type multidrug transport system fused ATPase/permease subunit
LLVFPLRLIGYALSELPRSMAAWTRIQEVVNEPLEPDPAGRLGAAPTGVGVEVDDLSFRHEGEGRAALSDVELRIPAGTTTAVVGPTGAGKSTLAELVVGLIAPTSGAVRVADGPRCIVFQEAFLLAGTVRENLVFGGPDRPDHDLHEALRLACADFVDDLPGGLDTVVGERGVTLSGGQRQRLALARALLRSPAVLVLDDTTSALDPATEARVLDNLRRALDGTTVVMVASRPSTIGLADDVVFLVGGRIVAHGRHEELMAAVPAYRELVEAFEADRAVRRDADVPAAAGGGG